MVAATSDAVRIVEVGARDGIQNISSNIPTAVKVELINRLRKTGCYALELTSIVSPKAVPQLADCKELLSDPSIKALLEEDSLRLPVLVPNLKGLEIALSLGLREIAVFVSASEEFSKTNVNCGVEEALQRAAEVARKARDHGLVVRGYVSCIFACPFGGPTPQQSVLGCVKWLLDAGCYEVSLGDTTGVGVPFHTKSLLNYLTESGIPASCLAGHFHDTYGQAIANVWAAYECGIRVFDSSVAGLGGCPFAPGARGNLSTEDVVYMFDQAGIHTGVDLQAVAKTGFWLTTRIRTPNHSRVGSALLAQRQFRPSPAHSRDSSRNLPRSMTLVADEQSVFSEPSTPGLISAFEAATAASSSQNTVEQRAVTSLGDDLESTSTSTSGTPVVAADVFQLISRACASPLLPMASPILLSVLFDMVKSMQK